MTDLLMYHVPCRYMCMNTYAYTYIYICICSEQFDLHMPLYTVYESLMFSAMLRLPHSISLERKKSFVDSIVHILELSSCIDSVIGDDSTPGIAAGQKKLVSIGVDVSANPSIL